MNNAFPRGTIARRNLLLSLPALALARPLAASPVGARRRASTALQRSIHSGHSLTDAYIQSGPWPGHLRRIAAEIGIPDPASKLVKSTIPGSPLHWRWSHPVEDMRPRDPTADARRDIADFDTLVLAEAGPPPRLGHAADLPALRRSLDHLCRFAASAIEKGDGGRGARDIALWSIWPSLTLWRPERPDWTAAWQDFPDAGAALTGYDESSRYLADHASHSLRQAYPALPADWRIWVFPGHRFIARLWQDGPVGAISGGLTLPSLFDDDIHPGQACGFGLACLMITCLYQTDLRQKRLSAPAGVSPALRDYFATIAWQIASSYAPAGLGGSEAAQPIWQAGRDPDLLPGWTLKSAATSP